MSRITRCNHCTLKQLRESAEKMGLEVTVVPKEAGSYDCYRHKKGQLPAEGEWVAWFMKLPKECRC